MKSVRLKKLISDCRVLAFALPFLLMILFMVIRGFTPFGKNAILYSDMYHQYYPFFVDFRRALLSGESLLYNWNIGMGLDYLGLISYYLASPLYLLSVLVPEGWLLPFFSLLIPVKIGLAGLFFSIFLNKLFGKNDLVVSLFGCFYGLCAWATGYLWNIMWLDTFALLPLVALGTVFLLRDKKFILYTVSLFLSIFSNYYIGLFTCIFTLLVFICYEICRWQGFVRFLKDLLRIALFSVLAIGMTAILELPALAALQNTYSSSNTFPEEFRLNMVSLHNLKGLFQAMGMVAGNMNGGIVPTFKEGLPNLYCGIGTTIFSFLFLTCKQVKLRDKICSVGLLLFFSLSFCIRQLDFIWHGFHFPNMIPYRFSFLYSFVVLYMGYRAYLLRRQFKLWQMITAGVLAIGLSLLGPDLTDPVYWAYNGVFLLLYITILLFSYARKKLPGNANHEALREFFEDLKFRRQMGGNILLAVFAIELILNMVNFGVSYTGTTISNYPRGTTYSASMIRYMQQREDDNLFYRAETTHSQVLNDSALNGYTGISTFTSSANVKVTAFMQALGYGARKGYNRYCFEESSPVANLFLGLKYMLERDGNLEENAYFDVVHNFGNVYLLENKAYLPLGFLANTEILDVNFEESVSPFALQNDLISQATGIDQRVWSLMIGDQLSVAPTDVTLTTQTQTGYTAYKTEADKGGSINYTYEVDREGFLCINLNLSERNSYTVWKNEKMLYSEGYSVPQMIAVSDVVPGDIIEIQFTCKEEQTGAIRVNAGVLDSDLFWDAYKILSASTMELTSFENTYVAGNIRCNRDGVLYTSIPQNGNWFATVDGEPAETVEIGGAMIGLKLKEGYHEITFSYRNAAFSLGWKISLGCLIIFIGACLLVYKPKPRKTTGKYTKR